MPDWLSFENVKALASPFVTLVAAGAAMFFTSKQVKIAKLQSDIALDKLKYDLFDKRYEIYHITKNVLEHILSNLDFEK